jgi:alpha-tubulin suppressor-like RCC1 family protein
VVAGGAHTCAIATDDSVYCWGDDAAGQLGTDGTPDPTRPTRLARGFEALSAGTAHTCGISGGQVWCWGLNGDLRVGGGTDGETVRSPRAVTLAVLGPVSPAAGDHHSCVAAEGQIHCWGSERGGRLGNAESSSNPEPAPEAVDSSMLPSDRRTGWTQVSAGARHTCGIAAGAIYCWGISSEFALGHDAPTVPMLQPVTAVGAECAGPDCAATDDWSRVAVGDQYGCAIARDDSLWCWGRNIDSQLGVPGAGERSRDPLPLTATDPSGSAVTGWSSLSVGASHACAISTGGDLFCWGSNDQGQLALPDAVPSRDRPTPIDGGRDWLAVGASRDLGEDVGDPSGHTCAVDAAGLVWCWGANQQGQLGDGTRVAKRAPVLVCLPPP